MFKEPRHDEVAPGLATACTVKADMATMLGQKRRERRIRRPIIRSVERTGYPGIVHCRQHEGWQADAGHEPARATALVIVRGVGEPVARRDEEVVVVPHRARAHDGGALGE